MKNYRHNLDLIILTIIPHYIALCFTYKDIYYSTIIILASSSSILWHQKRENDTYLYILDHFFAGMLTTYEIYNNDCYCTAIYVNLFTLLVNRITDLLSTNKILKYRFGHSFFH
jgi:hypothetical protein